MSPLHVLRKTAAWCVIGAVVPLIVDVATEPYGDRGIVESWFVGLAKSTGIIVATQVMSWATGEISQPPEPAV